jgi:hypothetical protein
MHGTLLAASAGKTLVVCTKGSVVALTVTRGGVESGGRAGHNGRASRRRYCPNCATRVSRSAKRCGYCRKLLPNWRRVAVIALLLAVMGAIAAHFVGII